MIVFLCTDCQSELLSGGEQCFCNSHEQIKAGFKNHFSTSSALSHFLSLTFPTPHPLPLYPLYRLLLFFKSIHQFSTQPCATSYEGTPKNNKQMPKQFILKRNQRTLMLNCVVWTDNTTGIWRKKWSRLVVIVYNLGFFDCQQTGMDSIMEEEEKIIGRRS